MENGKKMVQLILVVQKQYFEVMKKKRKAFQRLRNMKIGKSMRYLKIFPFLNFFSLFPKNDYSMNIRAAWEAAEHILIITISWAFIWQELQQRVMMQNDELT